MRYLSVVDNYFPDRPEGAPRVALDVALAMRDLGHDVSLLCRAPVQPDFAAIEIADGVRVLRLAPPRIPVAWRIVAGRMGFEPSHAVSRLLADESWDLIHLHSPILGAAVMKNRPQGSAVVYTVHSPIKLEQEIHWRGVGVRHALKRTLGIPALHRIERDLLQAVDVVHVLSRYTSECLKLLHGFDVARVIPHWASPERSSSLTKIEARTELGWPADAQILLTVRGHKARCGLDVAIKAIAPLVAAKNRLFVIAGDGPLREPLMQLADDLGCGDRITFPGRISDHQLALAYRAADLYLLPTLELECFGLTILESWSAGCVVLGTSVGAIPELLQPVSPNAIVPPGNADALRDRAAQFLSGQEEFVDPVLLKQHLDERFSRKNLANQMLSLFESARIRSRCHEQNTHRN